MIVNNVSEATKRVDESPNLNDKSSELIQSILLKQASRDYVLSLKEVIQPHLPVRLPCYDFILVISPTFGASLLAVESATSGRTNFRDVTGGVYKARERIHGDIADTPLLAIPTSCSRVADYNLN